MARRGRGARRHSNFNLVRNGEFTSSVDSWNPRKAAISWDEGRLYFVQTAGYGTASQEVKVVPGKEYEFYSDVEQGTANVYAKLRGTTTGDKDNYGGTRKFTFVASGDTVNIYLNGGSIAGDGWFDNLRVVEASK